jgi:heme-degrading monooxygenase HmoA
MFIILWEYVVAEGREVEFEKIYGADGDWTQLFKRSRGYLGTDLLRDPNHPRRYLTIDRWDSYEEFESFHENYRTEYKAMDERCNSLTEYESKLGAGTLILST